MIPRLKSEVKRVTGACVDAGRAVCQGPVRANVDCVYLTAQRHADGEDKDKASGQAHHEWNFSSNE